MMKKLLNPFALVAEGFVLGALLLFATTGADVESEAAASAPVVAQHLPA